MARKVAQAIRLKTRATDVWLQKHSAPFQMSAGKTSVEGSVSGRRSTDYTNRVRIAGATATLGGKARRPAKVTGRPVHWPRRALTMGPSWQARSRS